MYIYNIMKEKRTVIYYQDELKDEFSLAQITQKKIDENYKYDGIPIIRNITHFIFYRIIAIPIASVYLKFKYGHKIVGKEKIKQYYQEQKKKKNNTSFVLYGNHTNDIADALIPTMITLPKAAYVIVHPNNVSMPVLGAINPSLGAIPLPDNLAAGRNFNKCIKDKIKKGCPLVIYPEAHIWPFYTKIRPFRDSSFKYPIKYNIATFCFTNTYQKHKFKKTPKIVTYIDGPFYADNSMSEKENRFMLRNNVYDSMCQQSKNNTVELIKYIKKSEEGKTE